MILLLPFLLPHEISKSFVIINLGVCVSFDNTVIELINMFKPTFSVYTGVSLLGRPKSTLLMQLESQDTHIYMKTECLQTKRDATLFGWGKERIQ